MPVLKIKKTDGTWQEVWGATSGGSVSAPKLTTITLLADSWSADGSIYYQDITLSCVTSTSIVNLQPTHTQLASWQDDGFAFTTYSSDGSVRVYVTGGQPVEDYTVQVIVQEVIEV